MIRDFICILNDDLGCGDAGCYGSLKISKPNIDRMASEGTRCTVPFSTFCREVGLGNGNFQVEDIIRFAAEEGDFELIHSFLENAVWNLPCPPLLGVAEEMRIWV